MTRELKVWWIPQVPMKMFEVPVRTLREARLLTDTLAKYDIFQFENDIKPDYCNMGGVMIKDEDGWCDYYDEESGFEFDDLTNERIDELDAIAEQK